MKNISIAGTVGKDAETRTTQGGSNVTSWSIAVNGFANGEKTTDWFDVSMWGKRGEQAKQFATKGSKLAVSGEFSTREYNGKTYLQVNASDFTPMGGAGGNQGGGNNSGHYESGYGGPSGGAGSQAPAASRDLDDEIPF